MDPGGGVELAVADNAAEQEPAEEEGTQATAGPPPAPADGADAAVPAPPAGDSAPPPGAAQEEKEPIGGVDVAYDTVKQASAGQGDTEATAGPPPAPAGCAAAPALTAPPPGVTLPPGVATVKRPRDENDATAVAVGPAAAHARTGDVGAGTAARPVSSQVSVLKQVSTAAERVAAAAGSCLPPMLQVVHDRLNADAAYAEISAAWSKDKTGVTAEMGCPKTAVGSIIGKGGSMKAHLQQQSGAEINIDQTSMGPLEPRKITVKGSEWGVNTAMHLIRGIIQSGVPECPAAEAVAVATAGGATAVSRQVPCATKLLSQVRIRSYYC